MATKMKIFVSLLVCFSVYGSVLFAQKTVIWKGGTPGHETQWQYPGNWLGNHPPDEFSNVTIPDVSTSSMAYPVVNNAVEINSLRLESNAALTIAPEGRLTVLNDIFIVHMESLKVEGVLNVMNGMEQNIKDTARAVKLTEQRRTLKTSVDTSRQQAFNIPE